MGNRISDREALELVSGATPSGRPELGGLAETISEMRQASAQLSAPSPNASLALILDGRLGSPVSNTDGAVVAPSSIAVAATVSTGARAAFIMGVKKMITWPSGLELPSKIVLGAGLVVAAATGVGAAGALPGPAQSAFDLVVSPVTGQAAPGEVAPPVPGEEKNNDGVDPDKPKDPAPLPSDKPKDPSPSPTDKPKDPVPPPADTPKDPVPPPSDKPKDPSPSPTDKPKDPTPPPTDKPKDPTPPPTDKPKEPSPSPTDKPKDPPTGGSGSETPPKG